MDTLLYLLIFVCLGIVAAWYVGNEIFQARGGWGPLAIRDLIEGQTAAAEDEPRYKFKDRVEPQPAQVAASGVADAQAPRPGARFREKGPRGFRDRDEARYRSRGPLPRFGETTDKRS